MQYCTQCGTVISSQAKFCPSCGLEMSFKSPAVKEREQLPEGMEKGVVKSLQDRSEDISEKQIKESVDDLVPKKNALEMNTDDKHRQTGYPPLPGKHFSQPNEQRHDPDKEAGVSFWIWIYLIFNLVLGYLGYRIVNVMWILAISGFIIIGVWIRKGKLKPYNWLIKILIVGQIIILPELLYPRLQYMVIDAVTILFVGILILDFLLLFKGNKK
ncbi:MAG: zinc ribbon domain-containing protein [Saprospiraceae bacterium]